MRKPVSETPEKKSTDRSMDEDDLLQDDN